MQDVQEKLIIQSGKPLTGEVSISGAKNAVLKLMAASLLPNDICVIKNVPELSDVQIMIDVLSELGAVIDYDKEYGVLTIDSKNITGVVASDIFVSKMRASFVVLGPLVGRMHEACVAMPGGCRIGERRVDFHIKGLQALGCQCDIKDGYVYAVAKELKGAEICLDIPSVGATENIMMASVLANGTTVIQNAAQEPEIVDLANFLNTMGAKIEGAGTNQITITGVMQSDLHGVEHTTIPDRIEAGTYMSAVIATKGHAFIKNIYPNHLTIFTGKLLEMGAKIKLVEPHIMEVSSDERLEAMNFITQPYPGFPTDLQALAMTLLSTANGISVVTESLYENRFMHINELWRMGANIRQNNNHAIIKGVDFLVGTEVVCTDLRAGAALVIAGLMAKGESVVKSLHHIDRGYEKFTAKLRGLGADIMRVPIDFQLSETVDRENLQNVRG
ncbi:MAG: UDP-N-acetylglucosamine 1-carboxyvinyltransferase [Candidatus Gastranaerophilales bacterium]|nr:UDP-N-acetylglucosamine 1-carboxyvinyltransferase [Candidatus Gastranaerophilales bacterium]